MWELVITGVFSLVKFLLEMKAKKKLSDEEFLKHIEAHQKRRSNVSNQAGDFENNMEELYEDIRKEEKHK